MDYFLETNDIGEIQIILLCEGTPYVFKLQKTLEFPFVPMPEAFSCFQCLKEDILQRITNTKKIYVDESLEVVQFINCYETKNLQYIENLEFLLHFQTKLRLDLEKYGGNNSEYHHFFEKDLYIDDISVECLVVENLIKKLKNGEKKEDFHHGLILFCSGIFFKTCIEYIEEQNLNIENLILSHKLTWKRTIIIENDLTSSTNSHVL